MLQFFTIIITVSVFLRTNAVPILPFEHAIKSSVLKDHLSHKGTELFDSSLQKGINGAEAISGFAEDGAKKHALSQDAGHYAQEDSGKKAHEDAASFLGENFHNVNGGTLANIGKKIGHKKGHHKSGFHNSYHKDESGNNASFYDDGNDEGDELFYDARNGEFGDLSKQNHHGSHVDGQLYAGGQSKHGVYDVGGHYDNNHGDNRKYNQEKYYQDKDLRGVSKYGSQYGESGKLEEEELKHHVPHHYHHDPYHTVPVPVPIPQPVPAVPYHHQKITVYEDPRVYQQHQVAYDPNIDFRPAPVPLYNKPVYDYYGY